MNKSRSNEIKTGIISLLAIILLIFNINFINKNSGSKEQVVKFIFDRSVGIKPSAPIYVNGVERGSVSTIENNEGKVLITGFIDKITDFKKDVSASILVLELTGGKKIEINPGIDSEVFSGEFIYGANISDLSELVEKVTLIADDAGRLVKRLDTLSGLANNIIGDTAMIADVKIAIKEGRELIENANSLLDKNYNKINTLIIDLRYISSTLKNSIDKNEPKISQIIDKLDLTLNSADALLTNANNLSVDAEELISKITKTVDEIKSNESAMNKILYDKDFAVRLDSAVVNLSELVKFIEQYGVNVNLRIGTRP